MGEVIMCKNNSHYMAIADKLKALLASCTNYLSESEIELVSEFIDVAEYGLALETLADVVENEIQKDDVLREKILELADNMQIRSNETISRFEKGSEV